MNGDVSPILARWNAKAHCIDAKCLAQMELGWSPLSCSDALQKRLMAVFTLDPGRVMKVTPYRCGNGYWRERLERHEGVE